MLRGPFLDSGLRQLVGESIRADGRQLRGRPQVACERLRDPARLAPVKAPSRNAGLENGVEIRVEVARSLVEVRVAQGGPAASAYGFRKRGEALLHERRLEPPVEQPRKGNRRGRLSCFGKRHRAHAELRYPPRAAVAHEVLAGRRGSREDEAPGPALRAVNGIAHGIPDGRHVLPFVNHMGPGADKRDRRVGLDRLPDVGAPHPGHALPEREGRPRLSAPHGARHLDGRERVQQFGQHAVAHPRQISFRLERSLLHERAFRKAIRF